MNMVLLSNCQGFASPTKVALDSFEALEERSKTSTFVWVNLGGGYIKAMEN